MSWNNEVTLNGLSLAKDEEKIITMNRTLPDVGGTRDPSEVADEASFCIEAVDIHL